MTHHKEETDKATSEKLSIAWCWWLSNSVLNNATQYKSTTVDIRDSDDLISDLRRLEGHSHPILFYVMKGFHYLIWNQISVFNSFSWAENEDVVIEASRSYSLEPLQQKLGHCRCLYLKLRPWLPSHFLEDFICRHDCPLYHCNRHDSEEAESKMTKNNDWYGIIDGDTNLLPKLNYLIKISTHGWT